MRRNSIHIPGALLNVSRETSLDSYLLLFPTFQGGLSHSGNSLSQRMIFQSLSFPNLKVRYSIPAIHILHIRFFSVPGEVSKDFFRDPTSSNSPPFKVGYRIPAILFLAYNFLVPQFPQLEGEVQYSGNSYSPCTIFQCPRRRQQRSNLLGFPTLKGWVMFSGYYLIPSIKGGHCLRAIVLTPLFPTLKGGEVIPTIYINN